MKTGTKSILFGVHCFFWHPVTVASAWRSLFGRWPRGTAEWLAIIFHDVGYWGSSDMDGVDGQNHPARSAALIWSLRIFSQETRNHAARLILGHSKFFSQRYGYPQSRLYAPDKISIMFDPPWFYLLRAKLSGEVWEYMDNSPVRRQEGATPKQWLAWYRDMTRDKFDL